MKLLYILVLTPIVAFIVPFLTFYFLYDRTLDLIPKKQPPKPLKGFANDKLQAESFLKSLR